MQIIDDENLLQIMLYKTLLFYTKRDFNRLFSIDDKLVDFAFPFKFIIKTFYKYDQVFISNVPQTYNLFLMNYCIKRDIPFKIIVDSILEPIHLSYWPRWRKKKLTGAYQLISNNVVHPLHKISNLNLPKELYEYVNMRDRFKYKKNKVKIGITVSNTPASSKKKEEELLSYFRKIIIFLEKNKIDYEIRDRSNFFSSKLFFRKRLKNIPNSSLEEFFKNISHLITVPGSLVILGGISKIYVAQIVTSNMFANTPSSFLATTNCPPNKWIKEFTSNKTLNHKFQKDYYDFFVQQNISNSNANILVNEQISNNSNKFIFFDFLCSIFIWDIKVITKILYNSFLNLINK